MNLYDIKFHILKNKVMGSHTIFPRPPRCEAVAAVSVSNDLDAESLNTAAV